MDIYDIFIYICTNFNYFIIVMNKNKFEEAIDQCDYSSDWYEYRCNLAFIVERFIQTKECEWYHIYEKDMDDTKFRAIAFYIYDSLYVWVDTIVNGKLESSQLDKPYNDWEATVLYCNVENAPQFSSLLFQWIDKGEIKQLC